MVASSEMGTHKFPKIPATTTRWDLKDRTVFSQWHSDLRRIAKYVTAPSFLGSMPPGLEAEPSSSGLLFDVIMASITLDDDQFQHVEEAFGRLSDGNALYEWVISHADDAKASAQGLKKLVIHNNASADDVDEVLKTIQVSWPKIKGYDNSTPAESIEFALGLFRSTYVRMPYIAALMVHQDGGGRWRSFAEFRKEVVERLKCMDVREGVPVRATGSAKKLVYYLRPVVPLGDEDDDEMDEGFWEALDAAHAPSVLVFAENCQEPSATSVCAVEEDQVLPITDEQRRVAFISPYSVTGALPI